MLTGEKVCEYTISSTSQILDPRTKDFDKELLEAAGVDASVFSKPVFPGTVVGTLTDALAQYSRLGKVNVVSVAGHDTASAVAAVPALDENFAYLSSGTWSLMGIESKEPVITPETYDLNYTNEGGVEGTTRFLKNICGMWILEQCRKEWTLSGKDYSYPEIVEMAMSATPFKSFIQPDDPSFANPPSMLEAIDAFCERTGQEKPENDALVIRLIFESLALRYRQVLEDLDRIATHPIERLHIIGGGSKNRLSNQLTANAIGRKVIAGPSEATAIGNVMIQAMAAGVVSSLQEMRSIIHASVETEEFAPELVAEWEEAYQKFVTLK
jgi:rhamnulokinase